MHLPPHQFVNYVCINGDILDKSTVGQISRNATTEELENISWTYIWHFMGDNW